MMNNEKLNKVYEAASAAFWDVVARSFPEITSGDVAPEMEFEMEIHMKTWIEHWVDGNSTDF